jgi:RimJ/RimL family protein N-acetyltransferase
MIVLETERMTLRQMDMQDVANLRGIFSDPEAMRYYPSTKDDAETRRWIKTNIDSYALFGIGLWIATLKDSQQFVGQCGLVVQDVEGSMEIEIGYLFLRTFWGQGLATEAARACRDYGFDQLGFTRLVSLIHVRNMASRRVAEKVGMTLEKEIIRRQMPICVYALAKHELPPPG